MRSLARGSIKTLIKNFYRNIKIDIPLITMHLSDLCLFGVDKITLFDKF